jgi:hypothetical protein
MAGPARTAAWLARAHDITRTSLLLVQVATEAGATWQVELKTDFSCQGAANAQHSPGTGKQHHPGQHERQEHHRQQKQEPPAGKNHSAAGSSAGGSPLRSSHQGDRQEDALACSSDRAREAQEESPEAFDQAALPAQGALLLITYLKSWQHMGRALLTCVSGCTCAPTLIDGHSSTGRHSVPLLEELQVSSARRCVLQLKVLEGTSSGEHKFKVMQLAAGARVDASGQLAALRRAMVRRHEQLHAGQQARLRRRLAT